MQFDLTVEGNVAAYPELRFTESGKALARFRVGHNTRRRNNGGEWVNGPTIWLTVTCWEALAERVVDSLKPGDTVTVTARDDLSVFAYLNRNTNKAAGELQVTAANVAMSLRFNAAESRRQPKTTEAADPWGNAYAGAYAEATAEAAATQATASTGHHTELVDADLGEPADMVTAPDLGEPAESTDRDPERAAAALVG